jgi:TonB-linked SusC/RagA family outer membrane protein
MKKFIQGKEHAYSSVFFKVLVYMKLSLILVVGFCFNSFARGYSQGNVKITLNLEKVSLGRAISLIEKKSGFRIFYSDDNFPAGLPVTMNIRDEAFGDALDELLNTTGFRYKILDNKAVVLVSGDNAGEPIHVSGKVTDSKNAPLANVSVKVRGSQLGTVTDANGYFDLHLPDNASPVLVFSYVGFVTREMAVTNSEKLTIILEQAAADMNEVVVVGYGKQKKAVVTEAISSVDGSELVKAPVANISNTLGGRVSGVLSRQSSGQPGSDNDQIQIRGIGTTGNSNPLVIVNGVPMNYDILDPSEVETVTILKDAAAVAPYGVAGANGVILVTTKRGKEGKISLNYDGYYGIQRPTVIANYLDAYGYASELNLANQNAGIAQPYDAAALQAFKTNSNLNQYPNSDWVHDVINFHAPITRNTLSFTGGSQKVRFFGSLGYLYQQGVVSVVSYKRYNLSADMDANVTPTTTVSLDIDGVLGTQTQPSGEAAASIFADVTEIPPILPIKFTNGMPGNALLPQIYQSGYNNNNNNFFNSRIQLEQKIPFVPGLAVKGVFSFQETYNFGKMWTLPVTFYSLNAQNGFTPEAAGPPQPTLNETFKQTQELTTQGYITYKRSFGKSDIDLLGVFEERTGSTDSLAAGRIDYSVNLAELSSGSSNTANFTNSGSSAQSAQIGWVYRADYAYAGKYLLELSGRYDGHYYFAPGHQYAFFPAASAGWRLSEEKFIKDNYNWIDNLKIRGSYGKSGNLAGGPFQYLTSYNLLPGAVFGGTNPYQSQGISENSQANPDITWETSNKADIGLDAVLWKGQLAFTIDFFKERRSDMLVNPNSVVPAEYGIGISQVNEGVMENKGFDFSVGTAQKLGKDFRLSAAFNFSFAENKLIQIFENAATYDNPNRRLTGKPYNTQFGLKAEGLYQESDFNADGTLKSGEPVPSFGPVAPGDIKYADLAGPPTASGKPAPKDGVIDINDYTAIGKPLFPELIYGLNLDLSWKGLDLTTLWQGAGDATIYLTDEMAYPFFNGAKIFSQQTNTWTAQNPNAKYPRLMPTPSTNNQQPSSFWMYNGDYLRLKTAQLGYTLPPSLMRVIKLKSVRFFAGGQNLLTFSGLKFLDPETGSNRGRYYFQQKTYSFGMNVGF